MQVGPSPQLQASITSAGLGTPNNLQNGTFGPSQDSVSLSGPGRSSTAVKEGLWTRFTNWFSGKNTSGKNSSLPPWLAILGGGLTAAAGILLFRRFRPKAPSIPSAASSWKRSPEDIRTLDLGKQPFSSSQVSEIEAAGSAGSAGKVKRPLGEHKISVQNGYAHEWVTLANSREGMSALKDSILKSLKKERYMGSGSYAQAFAIPLRARDVEKKLLLDQPVLRVDQLGEDGKKLDASQVKDKMLTVIGKTQVQKEYRVVPIKYGPQAEAMLNDPSVGIPFAVVIPKGHPAFNDKYVGVEDMANIRGTVLRRLDGEKLNERKGVLTFADVLSRTSYLEAKIAEYNRRLAQAKIEVKKRNSLETKQTLKNEIATLEQKTGEMSSELKRTKRCDMIHDLHAHIKANFSSPNFSQVDWERRLKRYSYDDKRAYNGFVKDYLTDVKQLGDMPEETVDKLMKSLKNIHAAGGRVDYSHGANMFYDAENKQWDFIDLALTKAEKKTSHTHNALSLDDFANVALGKSSWGLDFLPSRYVQGYERKTMEASMESFLSNLETAARNNGVSWNANAIRRREGLEEKW